MKYILILICTSFFLIGCTKNEVQPSQNNTEKTHQNSETFSVVSHTETFSWEQEKDDTVFLSWELEEQEKKFWKILDENWNPIKLTPLSEEEKRELFPEIYK